jgi:predicted phosphodiesterase
MEKKSKLILSVIIVGSFIFASSFTYLYMQYNSMSKDSENAYTYYFLFINPIDESSVPQGIRLTVVDGLNDTIGISWFTTKNASNPMVEYSLNSDLSDSISINANVSHISSSFIYRAKLNVLQSNKTYFYQVSSDIKNKTEIMNFKTLPTASNNTRFLVYGDSRTNRTARNMLGEKIMERFSNNFDFSIHTGDIVEDGRYQDQWNNYFIDMEALYRYKQGVFVEGNHEKGNNTKMYDNLLMNSNADNRYYAFSYNGMGFIILNSNGDAVGNDTQTEWLNETLFNYSQKNSFNFVYLHHPLLHELDNRINPYFPDKWCPLIDKYNVSLIFCGHNHHYERSFPMTNSTSLEYNETEKYNYSSLTDPIYIVTGGAGAPLYGVNDDPFIAKAKKIYNFVIVNVEKESERTTINLEAWGMPINFGLLQPIDNITITRLN